MTENTCPRCGATENYIVYGESSIDTWPYHGDTFNGVGIWCADCKKWVVHPIAPSELEDLIDRLWRDGILETYL